MLSIILYIFGAICISYDVIIICLNPGTFLDNLFSFSHIWTVLGGYHIFLGVFHAKKGKSFWSTWNRKAKTIVLSLCSAGALISIIALCFITNPKTVELSEECDYVILLGGGIDKDGKLPPSVQKRVDKTAEYMLLHPECICVVTGGTLYWLPYPEAPSIKRSLIENGINPERILLEDQALDTIQNFQYSASVLANYKNCTIQEILDSNIVVVSSFYHLKRAEILAERMGFKNIKGLPSKTVPYIFVHSYVREICAYLKLMLRIIFTGQPSEISY